ncbi:hypothetical protein AK830_g7310 [Neonectria ditissima]|uniref:Actin-like ATPase domain-containing protein n=1 Tax=Neonectria ditissima TaxID=78410 RepID=A0A0P7AN86_9HYPO|nr:hypothetical protein AK830_g7310 [Neonectria ditissima]
MNSLNSEIMVGIDFGTTHSGVSWAINEGNKKIRLITDWPNLGDSISNQDKVPSVISYRNGRVANWGYEVSTKEESFKWVKLLLEPESKYTKTVQEVRDSNSLLQKLNKTAEEVISDYLRVIWRYTKEDIRKRVGDDDWEDTYTVHVVLTVPAMWSHAARDKTLKAARDANMPRSIRLVTEPEAAALATLRDKADENALSRGDTFVVCDAGGGTVDLITYKVNQISPLEVEECAISGGDLCGSIFLDTSFEKHIRILVGEDEYARIKPIHKQRMMRMFEQGVKRSFTLESNKDYSVDLRGIEDNYEEGIEDECITLKKSMLRTVFDYVCGQIDNLVQEQVNQVEDRALKVKAILLVGGFGSSKYLHQRLERSYSSLGIKVLQVDGAWSAICRGACMWGLDHTERSSMDTRARPKPTISSRISKYSYGISVAVPFRSDIHLEKDKAFYESKNCYMANNQMRWLLRRGETVAEGRVLNIQLVDSVSGVGFTSYGDRRFSQELLYSDADEPPERNDENVRELCSVNFTVPESKIWREKSYRNSAGEKWRDMTFDIVVFLGNATLDFLVAYRNEPVGYIEAKYMESF